MNLKAGDLAQEAPASVSMGQQLRTVGQGLESLDVEDFELQAEGDGYFALGIPRVPAGVRSTLQHAWNSLTGRDSVDDRFADPAAGVLRILFTPEGLLRLENAGKAKRSGNSAGVPNLDKLAQVLRIVGEYLDDKSARLLKARKRRDRISFEYATAADGHITEEWKMSKLYELWHDISRHRRERIDSVERALHTSQESSSGERER
jgi:hypothetical protein